MIHSGFPGLRQPSRRGFQETHHRIQATDSSRNPRIGHLTLEWVINHSGTFSIPIGLYDVLQTVGRFVPGSHSIIFRWAEFTSRLSTETAIFTSDMISL